MIRPALAIVAPAFVVYVALTRRWSSTQEPLDRLLAAALAPGLGIGLASCTYFFFLQWTAPTPAARLDALLWVAAAITGLAFSLKGWTTRRPQTARVSGSSPRAGILLTARRSRLDRIMATTVAAACVSIAALAVLWFLIRAQVIPHGEWDAWAIWNLRARAVWRGLPDWSVVFTPDLSWSNPDYPLLVPLSVVRLWAYAGAETVHASVVIAFLFLAATTATLVVFVGRLRGWVVGLLSGIALLGPTTYIFQASCQCADIPLGFFILVAVSLASWSRQAKGAAVLAMGTATTASALAAWTKNEGLLLFPLVAVCVLVSSPVPRRRALVSLLAGAALPAVTLAAFKLRYAPGNYLFELQSTRTIVDKILDIDRVVEIGGQVATRALEWGQIPGGALTVLAITIALTIGFDRRALERAAVAGFLVTVMLLGYVLVYVITPHDVRWHIATSFDRLFSQLWPAITWTTFQLSASPRPNVGPGA